VHRTHRRDALPLRCLSAVVVVIMKSKTGKPAQLTLIDAYTHITLSDSASFPEARFESEDELQTRADELQTRAAREAAIREFVEVQRSRREWISFVDIVEWYGNITGRTDQEAQEALRKSVELGDFETEHGGSSRIIFQHQAVSESRMTRSMLQNVIEIFGWAPQGRPNTVWNQYLSHCWISAADARKWFEAQGLAPPTVSDKPSEASELVSKPVQSPSETASATEQLQPVTATGSRWNEKRSVIRDAISDIGDCQKDVPALTTKILTEAKKNAFGPETSMKILEWYGGPKGRDNLSKMISRIKNQ
jgi:hypothetical protein